MRICAGALFVLAGLLALTAGTLCFKRLKTSAGLWQASGIQSLAAGIAHAAGGAGHRKPGGGALHAGSVLELRLSGGAGVHRRL